MTVRTCGVLWLCLAFVRTSAAWADTFPGASGMVKVDDTHYLCVQDWKTGDTDKARFGMLKVDTSDETIVHPVLNYTPIFTPVSTSGEPGSWPSLSNDLECICGYPWMAGDYLACQSKGAILRVRLVPDAGNYRIDRVGAIPMPSFGLADDVEGIACLAVGADKALLIFGQRGGGKAPGHLRWGWLTPDDKIALSSEAIEVTAPFPHHYADERDISDLYLDSEGQLWAAAAVDAGNNGPFQSYIRPIARVDGSAPQPLTPIWAQAWDFNGIKIEALAAPCPVLSGNPLLSGTLRLSFATDDEFYDGLWRLLVTN